MKLVNQHTITLSGVDIIDQDRLRVLERQHSYSFIITATHPDESKNMVPHGTTQFDGPSQLPSGKLT
jgi:hypothetical protein